jgi:hypothetical protein
MRYRPTTISIDVLSDLFLTAREFSVSDFLRHTGCGRRSLEGFLSNGWLEGIGEISPYSNLPDHYRFTKLGEQNLRAHNKWWEKAGI